MKVDRKLTGDYTPTSSPKGKILINSEDVSVVKLFKNSGEKLGLFKISIETLIKMKNSETTEG